MTTRQIMRLMRLEKYPRDYSTHKVSWRGLRLGTVARSGNSQWWWTFETGKRSRLYRDQASCSYRDAVAAARALVRVHLRAIDKQQQLRLRGSAAA